MNNTPIFVYMPCYLMSYLENNYFEKTIRYTTPYASALDNILAKPTPWLLSRDEKNDEAKRYIAASIATILCSAHIMGGQILIQPFDPHLAHVRIAGTSKFLEHCFVKYRDSSNEKEFLHYIEHIDWISAKLNTELPFLTVGAGGQLVALIKQLLTLQPISPIIPASYDPNRCLYVGHVPLFGYDSPLVPFVSTIGKYSAAVRDYHLKCQKNQEPER